MIFDFSALTTGEVVLAIFGYIVVFCVLLLIYVVFNNMPTVLKGGRKLAQWYQGRHESQAQDQSGETGEKQVGDFEISAEENAAISAAIYLYINETHDEEERVLTKKTVTKPYSPWSSKIYTVHNFR